MIFIKTAENRNYKFTLHSSKVVWKYIGFRVERVGVEELPIEEEEED